MRTLLIDDLRSIPATIVTRTYEDGVKALTLGGPFDILYLDHDLGDEGTPERTGYTIMCFLEANPEYLPKEIVIVSSNPVGRQKMQVVIDKLYREVR